MISLEDKLKRIDKVFGIDNVRGKKVDVDAVKRYYRINRFAYKVFHSWEGFVHMGISRDGVFKKEDLYEQPKFVEGYIKNLESGNVLELAAGKGASLKFLSKRNPNIDFYGLDLSNGQFGTAKSKLAKMKNVKLVEGDYHDLSCFDENMFDVVYVIESLCHSTRKDMVSEEVYRVLKSDGLFVVIDGYLGKDEAECAKDELVAIDLISKGMAVDSFWYYQTSLKEIESSGLRCVFEENVTAFIVPTLRRIELLSEVIFKNPSLGKIIAGLFPKDFAYNAVSAYLMPDSVKLGFAKYMVSVFQKKS